MTDSSVSEHSEAVSDMEDVASPSITALCRTDYYCMLGLCGLVLAFYAQLWMPGLVLIKRDAFQFFLPIKQYIIDRLSAGELPQWFPYEGMGRPLLSIPSNGVFHPFTILYWLFPVQDAYRYSTLLSCLAASLGAYLLGRSLGLPRGGAFVSGTAFSGSGYIVSLTDNLLYLYSACMLPLFLAALEKTVRTGRLWHACVAALVWGSILLQGDIQTGYYYGFIALLWVCMRSAKGLKAATMHVALIVGLTLLIGGVQIIPAWTVFEHSDRAEAQTFHSTAVHWSTHPLRLLSFVFPFEGDDYEHERIARMLYAMSSPTIGPGGYWAESLYIGIPAFVLAVMGCWRRREALVFVVLGGGSLILALGQYGVLYDVFYRFVPLWSAFRYPEKLMSITSLSLCMLAGWGVDTLIRQRAFCRAGFVVAGVCAIGSGLWAIESVSSRLPSWVAASPHLEASLYWLTPGALLYGLGMAGGLGVLSYWLAVQPSRQRMVLGCVVTVIALDLARVNLPALQTASSELWRFTPSLSEAVRQDASARELEHFRILSIKEAEGELSPQLRSLPARERFALIRKQGLYVEHNAVQKLESIQGYLPGTGLAFDQIGRKASLQSLARFNVAYLIGSPLRFGQGQYRDAHVASLPGYALELVRNPAKVTPRTYLSVNAEAVPASSNVVSFLERDDFLRGEADALEGGAVSMLPLRGQGQVRILEYHPELIRIDVEAFQDSALILVDAFEPGWEATIGGGNQLEILRANGLVRGMIVPKGHSQITLSYRTPGLLVGGLVSLVGLGTCLLIGTGFRERCIK